MDPKEVLKHALMVLNATNASKGRWVLERVPVSEAGKEMGLMDRYQFWLATDEYLEKHMD